MAQWVTSPASIHEDVGLIPSLTQWVKIWCCHELWYSVGLRCGLDPLAAAAPIWLLAWELPYAQVQSLKKKKKKLVNWEIWMNFLGVVETTPSPRHQGKRRKEDFFMPNRLFSPIIFCFLLIDFPMSSYWHSRSHAWCDLLNKVLLCCIS